MTMTVGWWNRRELIARLTAREITQRYRGTYLGLLWSLVTPLVLLAIYTFVFSVIFRARWDQVGIQVGTGEFAFVLFAGLIPFGVFAEVVNRAPGLVLNAPTYVKKVVFPLEVLPVVALLSALMHSLVSVAVLLVGRALVVKSLSLTVVLLPLAYLPLGLLCLGVGWFLASLGVFVRDVSQSVSLVVQVLFFLTPIFYPVTAVPERFRFALQINPMTPIIDSFRRSLLWGQGMAWTEWAQATTIAAAFAILGYMWFMKTKSGFADVM